MNQDSRENIDNTNKDIKVIAIGRQFGSGGRKIGKLISKKTGYKYYDSELLAATAEKMGFSRHVFDIHDEKRTTSPLRSMLQGIFGLADNFHDVGISTERFYLEQIKVIREICKKQSCVIVGRTADFILRDHPGLTSVFLHAPLTYRAQSVLRRGEAKTLQEAIEKAKKFDRERESYYNYFTGSQSWGKAWNYSLTIDSSLAEATVVADLILAFAKERRQE